MNEKSFHEILAQLASAVNENPDKDIMFLIEQLASQFGISDKDLCIINKSFDLIDKTSSIVEEMNEARKNGLSRQEYIADKVESIVEKLPEEEQAEVLTAFDEASKSLISK